MDYLDQSEAIASVIHTMYRPERQGGERETVYCRLLPAVDLLTIRGDYLYLKYSNGNSKWETKLGSNYRAPISMLTKRELEIQNCSR